MFRLINALLVAGLLISAYFIYRLEHATRSGEREIARLEAMISGEEESFKLLTAEWSLLTRPDRIQHLAQKHLNLKVISPLQVIKDTDIPLRLPGEPVIAPGTPGTDPIGAVLRELDEGQQ
jgi:cell division protein FtsL